MIENTGPYFSRRTNSLRVNNSYDKKPQKFPEAYVFSALATEKRNCNDFDSRFGRFLPLPKTCAQRDNIWLTGTYLVPLEPRTLLTNS